MDLIDSTEQNYDTVQAQAIMEILQQEAQKKTWRRINYSTRAPRSGNPLAIQVETPTNLTTYDTEEEVFDHLVDHLSIQFCLAYTAPLYSSTILDNIGHLGDTQCALDILDGN
jgi:hypothetical protein